MKFRLTEDKKGFCIDRYNNWGICFKIVPKFELKSWTSDTCGIKSYCIIIGLIGIGIGVRKVKL